MIQDDIRSALISALSAEAFVALTAIPGFGWVFALPVIRNVVQYVIQSVVRWAVTETAVGLSLLWIQIEMQYDIKTAEDARRKLNDMINNPALYTETQQAEISENFDDTTIALIQLGIARL